MAANRYANSVNLNGTEYELPVDFRDPVAGKDGLIYYEDNDGRKNSINVQGLEQLGLRNNGVPGVSKSSGSASENKPIDNPFDSGMPGAVDVQDVTEQRPHNPHIGSRFVCTVFVFALY